MANQWDNVPWMIGGGVKHSLSISRLLSHAAFNGEEGILGAKDLQVTALTTPGGGVRVWPGACAIKNRQNDAAYESYAARLPYQDTVNIAAAGGAARTDLIVVRVEDPFVPGSPWQAPSQSAIDNDTAEFVRTAVISNVSSTTTEVPAGLGYSAIPLARVTVPANTSNISQGMITDLRRLTTSRTFVEEKVIYPAATRTLVAGAYMNWPLDANMVVQVPRWATHVQGKAIMGGVVYGPLASAGSTRLRLGTLVLGGATAFDLPDPATSNDRTTLMTAGVKTAVPAAMRGTEQTAQIEGDEASGSDVRVTTSSSIAFDLRFSQQPESNL